MGVYYLHPDMWRGVIPECISVLFYKHGEDITMWVIIIALILGFFLSIFDSAKRY